ncbi:type VI secretion system amidase immunity protein Tai4 [Frateuria aurantia]|uniref:type VI secretion system amidase immunity protein Tai4 n=1 Tax=Frateuria aurantia TaxID=81475 RepID=UPI0012E9C9EA|nr:type VI secretion system amidase immunity protein Tai4 [Frateuria aurantia]
MKWTLMAGLMLAWVSTPLAIAFPVGTPQPPKEADLAVKTQVDVRSFKDAVLAICLAEAYRHDPIPAKDLQASIAAWRRSTVLDQKQVDKYVTPLVDAYVQRDYFNPLAETEVRGLRFDFLKCLDLYHDPILDRVVKKLEEDINHRGARPLPHKRIEGR